MEKQQFLNSPLKRHSVTASGVCPRGHSITGSNAKRNTNGGYQCRTCHTAFNWARNHNYFYDDERVITHMQKLYAMYQERDANDSV